MKIDLCCLSAQLKSAVEAPFSLPAISPYMKEHIYEPLLKGDSILLTALDFSKFSPDDIDALIEHLQDMTHEKDRLVSLNRVFCDAHSVSTRMRAFC